MNKTKLLTKFHTNIFGRPDYAMTRRVSQSIRTNYFIHKDTYFNKKILNKIVCLGDFLKKKMTN